MHKSQGLTFSRVVIDFTGGVFAGGQAYVALSRCTSLEGIQLKKPISRADIFVRPEIVSFSGRFNEKEFFDAENCLNRAVSLRPSEFKALYNRGKLRLQTENIEGALSDLDKATSLKPEHPGAHELFGDALLKVGKATEAAIQWRIAEELRKKKK